MVNKKKIILMSKLAVYDKNNGESDRQITKLFRSDFIYKQNMVMRFYVIISIIIIFVLEWLYKIFIQNIDLFDVDYKTELINRCYILLAVLIFYSIVGGIKSGREYDAAKSRTNVYFKLLGQLDRVVYDESQDTTDTNDIFKEASDYGAGIDGKGNLD